jgi:hypothetical protein
MREIQSNRLGPEVFGTPLCKSFTPKKSCARTEIFMSFSLLNVFALLTWVVLSLLHLNVLAPLSAACWVTAVILLIRQLGRFRLKRPDLETLIGPALSLGYGVFVWFWFKGVWASPSNDDTINHLSYLSAILEQKTCLIGHTVKPGAFLFGSENNHFYPTGSHALIALWGYPLNLLGMELPELLRLTVGTALVFWPWLLWVGTRVLSPELSIPVRLFLVTSAITMPVFPLWPLGEGGVSRILAQIALTPLWFTALANGVNGFLWAGIISPALLFIHPSILPFLGLPLILSKKPSWPLVALGGLMGALIFFLILRSGTQEVFLFSPEIPFRGWFDRLKGPFHFWFSDPYGFGKFLSFKNFPIYIAIVLILKRHLRARVGLMILSPFILAALGHVPDSLFNPISLIYYHSVKRISELTPLLGLTIACMLPPNLIAKKSLKTAATILSILYLFLFFNKSIDSLNDYHALYRTPRTEELRTLKTGLASIPNTAIIINDDHNYDALRFVLKPQVFNKWSECSGSETNGPYCTRRVEFIAGLHHRRKDPLIQGREIWWIPEAGASTPAPPTASIRSLPLSQNRRIYRIL